MAWPTAFNRHGGVARGALLSYRGEDDGYMRYMRLEYRQTRRFAEQRVAIDMNTSIAGFGKQRVAVTLARENPENVFVAAIDSIRRTEVAGTRYAAAHDTAELSSRNAIHESLRLLLRRS